MKLVQYLNEALDYDTIVDIAFAKKNLSGLRGYTAINEYPRLLIREYGQQSSIDDLKKVSFYDGRIGDNVIGWFATKNNMAFGWTLIKPDKNDIAYIKKNGMNPKDIFRSVGFHGTNFVKINLKTGTYAFADNQYELETDKLKFDKMSKYNRLVVDNYKGDGRELKALGI